MGTPTRTPDPADILAAIEQNAELREAVAEAMQRDEIGSVARVIRMMARWTPEVRAGLLREIAERWRRRDPPLRVAAGRSGR